MPGPDAPQAGSGFVDPPEPPVYQDRWESIWSAGLPAGVRWDQSQAAPALQELLRRGAVDVRGKRVLVPGCGRGYDIPEFAAAGAAEVVGLELAPTAVARAREYLTQGQWPGDQGSRMRVEEGDFMAWADPAGPFDVGFDYTFGCAMHPTMRHDWATHWARSLAPGGVLVALVFPVNPAADPNAGPPFPVTPELYKELLQPQGFEVTFSEPVDPSVSLGPRKGREHMMLLRRK
ncbi:hypothetical protein HYH03_018237 [Edaphochlamys debaryana]|uniref:Thiopurine S-methyltransferase n=1 Tax=Edaphochlamys debaryana TaxID=47281 RepID=A0A836BN43_9CHLO|nr:hypothetical protein HYH03_018237 [Edaphochlamys debaryana]|eukprot:KAG2482846.1 hypothetical protein HYH03_018237 [Edaphochlamys debaryana]